MRQHERKRVLIPCVLTGPDEANAPALLEDLSLGGAGLRVRDWHGWADFTLRFSIGDRPYRFACTTRHEDVFWDYVFVHAQFSQLPADRAQELGELIEFLKRTSDRIADAAQVQPRRDSPSAEHAQVAR